MAIRNICEALVLALLSAVAVWGALQVPDASPGETWAGIVPFGAAVALGVIAAISLLDALRSHRADTAGQSNQGSPGCDHPVHHCGALPAILQLVWVSVTHRHCGAGSALYVRRTQPAGAGTVSDICAHWPSTSFSLCYWAFTHRTVKYST